MTETKKIVLLIQRNPQHFIAEYYRIRNEHRTDREAYEAIELTIKNEFGITRYSNFESFKQQKNSLVKKLKRQ
jgi:hypothetical protein